MVHLTWIQHFFIATADSNGSLGASLAHSCNHVVVWSVKPIRCKQLAIDLALSYFLSTGLDAFDCCQISLSLTYRILLTSVMTLKYLSLFRSLSCLGLFSFALSWTEHRGDSLTACRCLILRISDHLLLQKLLHWLLMRPSSGRILSTILLISIWLLDAFSVHRLSLILLIDNRLQESLPCWFFWLYILQRFRLMNR